MSTDEHFLVETLNRLELGNAPRISQGDYYTQVPLITKEMARINWNEISSENYSKDDTKAPFQQQKPPQDNDRLRVWLS